MDLGLKNKKVLITGGSKGIGLACARAFIAEGARAAIVSRSQDNLDQAKKALGDAYTIAADLSADVWRLYRGYGLPTHVFIDRDGRIRKVIAGPLTADQAAAEVEAILPAASPGPLPPSASPAPSGSPAP